MLVDLVHASNALMCSLKRGRMCGRVVVVERGQHLTQVKRFEHVFVLRRHAVVMVN